jgi:hypothetical protein
MSSAPPRKGKKRPAPQTPSGRPPAKASRPSTPTASTSDHPLALEAEELRRKNPGVSPEIPPFRPRSGASKTSSTPTRESTAVPMDEDRGTSPLSDSTLAFTTVETEIDDDEAELSFKEMLDWMRYIAQHKGQRACLLDLTDQQRAFGTFWVLRRSVSLPLTPQSLPRQQHPSPSRPKRQLPLPPPKSSNTQSLAMSVCQGNSLELRGTHYSR